MKKISRRAVRESVDCLGMGLCYCTESGRILLINRQMRILAERILGKEVSNALSFYEEICQGIPGKDIARLEYGKGTVLGFSQGDVWQFSRQTLFLGRKPIVLLQAINITAEHQVRLELEQRTAALRAMQERLKQYGQDLQEVTIMEERLQTKVRIHGELGRVLLASRQILKAEEEASEEVLEQWNHTIHLLKGMPVRQTPGIVSIVQTAAQQLGVHLEIRGPVPEDQLAADILAEALNNAVRHGQATAMSVSCRSDHHITSMEITNNGSPVFGLIPEGGGLSGLRRRIERAGGSMKLSGDPFRLEVWFPKYGKEQ